MSKKKSSRKNKSKIILNVILVIIIIAIVIFTLFFVVRYENPETETQEETTEQTVLQTTEQTTNETVFNTEGLMTSYLTGEWIDEDLGSQRPVAIMYNNIEAGTPQCGIENASIVYEAPVEGGICRLMALFEDYDDLERIGSIRSARTYFVMFALEYDAIYMHHGQASYAKDILETIDDLDCGGTYGSIIAYRVTDRVAPHNSFTTPAMIKAGISAYGYDTDYEDNYTSHFNFTDDDSEENLNEGITANTVKPGYVNNAPWFEYNEEEKVYYRFQFGEEQIDELTGNQISYKNIILQYCDYTMYGDSSYLNIDVTSGGEGMYITNGKAIDITWEKDGTYGVTHYYDSDGNEITLNQGKTWVCIVLTDALYKIEILS